MDLKLLNSDFFLFFLFDFFFNYKSPKYMSDLVKIWHISSHDEFLWGVLITHKLFYTHTSSKVIEIVTSNHEF